MRFPLNIGLLAFVLGMLFTPLFRRLAIVCDIVDRPDGHRKLHGRTVPMGGGIAVLFAASLSIIILYLADSSWTGLFTRNWFFVSGLGAASFAICALGLIDDRFTLRGRQKLAGQIFAIGTMMALGRVVINEISIFGYTLELGLLAYPFTMFWLLGAINALNLIDGVDGLATTVGIIFSVTLAAMAWMNGAYVVSACATVMAGSLCGFLIYNLPPAKIFLGDAGSMLIGLVLGTLAIRSSLKSVGTVAMVTPTAIWAVLIFDVGMAIVRRKLTGQSLYASDRGHLHHTLLKRGFSGQTTVLIIGLLCTICCIGAIISVAIKDESMAVITAVAVIGTLVATRFFGYSEVRLLWQRGSGLFKSLLRFPNRPGPQPQPVASRFSGKREWDQLWNSLIEFADRFDLTSLQLNVNSPAIGEVYHGSWERKRHPPENQLWRTEIPLFYGDLSVGRLIVSGTTHASESKAEDSSVSLDPELFLANSNTPIDRSTFAWLAELLEGLKPFEEQMLDLLHSEDLPASIPVRPPHRLRITPVIEPDQAVG